MLRRLLGSALRLIGRLDEDIGRPAEPRSAKAGSPRVSSSICKAWYRSPSSARCLTYANDYASVIS